jgi:hypothetical protein
MNSQINDANATCGPSRGRSRSGAAATLRHAVENLQLPDRNPPGARDYRTQLRLDSGRPDVYCAAPHLLHRTTQENPMTIIEQLNRAGQRAQARFIGYADSAVHRARSSAQRAADRIAAARTPVGTIAEATQRLNDVSHRYVEQLVRQQARTIEGAISDGARRLERAAQADGLKALVAGQVELYPASRERLKRDLKATWHIAASTGRAMGEVAIETYAQLIHGARTLQKPSARRAPARPRKVKRARKTKSAA